MLALIKNRIRTVRTALWFRPTAACVIAAATATLVAAIDAWVPPSFVNWLPKVDVQNVQELLKVLAGGMLTVTTVTLSVLTIVVSLASNQASPRAVPEIMADTLTQNALGSFLGTFVFALATLLMFSMDNVSDPGAALAFFLSIGLTLVSIRYLLYWIHHTANAMKLNRIVHSVYQQADATLTRYLDAQVSKDGGTAKPADPAAAQIHVHPNSTGYIQLIDESGLAAISENNDLNITMLVQEGDFVDVSLPVASYCGTDIDDGIEARLRDTIVIGFERSPEGDPRLGFELLAEIACRAMSPGINDPQSAITCVNYAGSLLILAGRRPAAEYPPEIGGEGRVRYLRPDFKTFLERAFRPLMRDGGAAAEVMFAIMDTIALVGRNCDGSYLGIIAEEAARAAEYGNEKLALVSDRKKLAKLAAAVTDG